MNEGTYLFTIHDHDVDLECRGRDDMSDKGRKYCDLYYAE